MHQFVLPLVLWWVMKFTFPELSDFDTNPDGSAAPYLCTVIFYWSFAVICSLELGSIISCKVILTFFCVCGFV
jgi:hypothetical protein